MFPTFTRDVPEDVLALFEALKGELEPLGSLGPISARRAELRKLRDQFRGGDWATAERYHPDLEGATPEQQKIYRVLLKSANVNLCEPALDRLVSSIHSGRIVRRVGLEGPVGDAVRLIAGARAYKRGMRRLCQSAFLFGTGYAVPMVARGGAELRGTEIPLGTRRLSFWHLNPCETVLDVNPDDVTDTRGAVELVKDARGAVRGWRFVTETHVGELVAGESGEAVGGRWWAHGLTFAPLLVARGHDATADGEKYGRSLVGAAADGSIRATRNAVNLELLRDRQTQALLVVKGAPARTSADEEGAANKFVQMEADGDARYETPESRLEQVIAVHKRIATDAAVSTSLPLDTFLPELVSGSDASATSARIRAFPLAQRLADLCEGWAELEEVALGIAAAVLDPAAGVYSAAQARERVGAEVLIFPSQPEAEAETLSNWEQRTANHFVPVEEALEFYSNGTPAEERERLARLWWAKKYPAVLTVNEIRERLGLPAVPWGGVPAGAAAPGMQDAEG